MPRGRKKKDEEVVDTATSTDVEVPMGESTDVEVEVAVETPVEAPTETEAVAEAPTEAPIEAPEPEVVLPELEVTERALPFGGTTLEVFAPDNCVYELSNLPEQYRGQLPQQYQ